jgi:hypothetical protein
MTGTQPSALGANGRRAAAIARSKRQRAAELAPLVAEVEALVAAVGWHQAAPVVVEIMSPVRVTGPRGAWRHRVGKRTGRRLVAALSPLPAQDHLPLVHASSRASIVVSGKGAEG